MKVRRLGNDLKFRAELFLLSIALCSAGVLIAVLSADIAIAYLGVGSGAVINIYLHYFQ